MTQAIPWRRVFVDGVVIIGSILLAFGIDAWWAEQGARAAERAELVRIRDELIADRSRVEADSRSHARRAAASLEILRLIADVTSESTVVELPDSLLALIVQSPTFEARTPALDGLQESGRIAIIRDTQVRTALASWERLLVNTLERETEARQFVNVQLVPALIERGDVGHVLRGARRVIRVGSWSEVGLVGSTRIQADLEFSGLVSQRYAMSEHPSNTLDRALGALDDLVTAIERALGP